jgi:hypothetical protein
MQYQLWMRISCSLGFFLPLNLTPQLYLRTNLQQVHTTVALYCTHIGRGVCRYSTSYYNTRYLAWAFSILLLVLPSDWPAMSTNYMLKWKMVGNAILTKRLFFFPRLVKLSHGALIWYIFMTREARTQLNLSL